MTHEFCNVFCRLQGYTSITGTSAWGIAWYLNDLLIPVLEMRRGTKYTFTISGGNTPQSNSEYHPFYLTTSSDGGYVQLTAAQRANQTVFAGIEPTEVDRNGGVVAFRSTLEAPICLYKTTDATDAALDGDFQKFFNYLDTSCQTNPAITSTAAVLEFTPDANTPDLIYYQCVTHRNLGWKIMVVDTSSTDVCNECKGSLFKGVTMRRRFFGQCREVCVFSVFRLFRRALGFECGRCA